MKYIKKKSNGLILINNKKFIDKRGYFKEVLKENSLNKKFPFQVMSFSKKGVIRGLHLQTQKSQGKFITVIKGNIFDVVVDLRSTSKTFCKIYCFNLNEKNSNSLYIPPGFAHGFQALDKENYIFYSCTEYRDKKSEISINPNDNTLKIKWPLKKQIISKRDLHANSLDQYLKKTNE